MKTILLATVAAAVVAAQPAFAARAKHRVVPLQAATPILTYGYPSAALAGVDPYVVTDGANYLGRDPDPNIRGEMLKDDTMHNGNAY